MLVAPSNFPFYFSQGDTAASNPSFNTAPAPAASADSKVRLAALNDAPSNASNDNPVTPSKGTQTPRTSLLGSTVGPNATSSPPKSKLVAAPLSGAQCKPAQSYNAPTAALEGNALSTVSNNKPPNTSPAVLPLRLAYRSSPYRTNTFNSVNQRMAHIEQRFTKRILRLETERDEQQATIQFLTEELERLIASLNSAPGSPIPIPVYDPIQAPPPPGALRPPLPPSGERLFFQHQPRGCGAPNPQNLCFWAPPTTPLLAPLPPSAVHPAFRGPQPYPHPAPTDQHYYPPAQQNSYAQQYPPPSSPPNQHYYCPQQQTSYTQPYLPPSQHDAQYPPNVQYPSVAPGYNDYTPSETVCHENESYDVPGNGFEGVEVMAC